jgi:hypothetical protein
MEEAMMRNEKRNDSDPFGQDGHARLATAEAMFAERCKKAGEFIYRTAENVEGVFLMKIRPNDINYGDQYKLDDPYGRDHGGDIFIQSLLRGFNTPPSKPTAFTPVRLGYRYVEAIDPRTANAIATREAYRRTLAVRH